MAIGASKRWCRKWLCLNQKQKSEARHVLRRAEAAQRLQGCDCLHRRRLGTFTGSRAGFSSFRCSQLGNSRNSRANRRSEMVSRNFFSELKRRNVYKVAVAYAVVAWLLIQAASIFFPAF